MIDIIICSILAMLMFNCMNQYSAKNIHGLGEAFKYSLITIPLQIIAYLLLVVAFSRGFRHFGEKIWIISLLVIFASYTTNLIVSWVMFRQVPVKGQALGFFLMLIGAILAVVWK